MVLGIGEGSIELQLDKDSYKPGEKIKGKLKLRLKKPKQARELRVRLVEETRSRGSDGSTRTTTTILSEKILGGQQEYESSEYEFELTTPQVASMGQGNPALGLIKGALEVFGVVPRVIYYVEASLDIPLSFDITKRVRISLMPE